jgi:hypothetical protein
MSDEKMRTPLENDDRGIRIAPIPQPLLERYRLGELKPSEMEAISKRLTNNPEAKAALEALDADDRDQLKMQSPESFVGRLQLKAHGDAFREAKPRTSVLGWQKKWTVPLAGAGAFALLTLVAVPGMRSGSEVDHENITGTSAHVSPDRIKGLEAGLTLYKRVGKSSELLEPGAKVSSGEALRIEIRSAGLAYGTVLSVDGNGYVTRHFPVTGDSAGKLAPGATLLPEAFELDDAPEYEQFYLIAGNKPFAIEGFVNRLREGDGLFPAPAHLSLSTYPLRKNAAPKGNNP